MLADLIKKHRELHTRNISLTTVPHDNDFVVVHGELRDERFVPIIDIFGAEIPPGTIHHITATLLIAQNPLRIIQAEAAMPIVPTGLCPGTLEHVSGLTGLNIAHGFSQKIRSIIGGSDGCAHLCTLLTTMGTEIVHGAMTWKRHLDKIQEHLAPLPQESPDLLVDSCRIWKKDGSRHKALLEAMEKRGVS